MQRDHIRLKAMQDLEEALRVHAPAPPSPSPAPGGAPPPPSPAPGGSPQGALARGAGMPQQRPEMSPLQAVPSFRSPPMQAALQGAEGIKGHPAMTRPVGFAEGGFVVFRR